MIRTTLSLAGLVAAHTMLETARDALFLGRLAPSRLTFVYAALAGLALIAASGNSAFVHRFGRRNALIFTLLGAAYGTVILFLLPMSPAVVFALYLWSALIGSLLVTQFWLLSGALFTVAQGKRLFGLLAAGGVIGAVAGATASAAALRFVGVEHLLWVAGAVFLVTALVVTTIGVDNLPRRTPKRSQRLSVSQLLAGGQVFSRNPYLTRLAVIVSVSTAAVLCTDYLFKSFAARSMTAEELGPFFAGYYAILNSVALVIQLFVAGPLVRRTGILTAFCLLPTLLLAGSMVLAVFSASITVVLLLKGADGSLRHSLHRISTELLWMPLPEDVKARSKAYVDTVVVRSAQAVTAGGLLLLATFGLDRPQLLAAIVAALTLVWLGLAAALRRPYLDLFRRALSRSTPDFVQGMLNLNIESVAVVVEALSSRDPYRAVAAIDVLESNRQQHVIPALILYHEAPEVLIRALEVITTPNRKDWRPLAERLLEHQQPDIRVAAVRALARVGDRRSLERRLLDIDPAVRAQAAFWMAKAEGGRPQAHPAVRQIIDMGRPAGLSAHRSLFSAIATAGDADWAEVMLEMCAGEDETDAEVMESLAAAIRRVQDDRFIPLLIRRLRYRRGRDTLREAIFEAGEPALDALENALSDPKVSRRVRRHVPLAIARFDSQRAADILLERLDAEHNGLIRFKILRALERLVVSAPVNLDKKRIEDGLRRTLLEYLRLLSMYVPVKEGLRSTEGARLKSGELLVGLMEDKLKQALDRAFRYLHLQHRSEDLRSVAVAVRSNDRRLRAQALEYLDALTVDASVSEVRALLRLVADDLPDNERVARAAPFLRRRIVRYHEALSQLVRDPDEALASIAAYHALLLNTTGLTDDVLMVSEERPTLSDLRRIVDHLGKAAEVPSVA